MNSKYSNDLTLFSEALEIAAPEARVAYLDRACGADAALRRKIDSLLAAYEKASDRFEDLDGNLPTSVSENTKDLESPGSVIGRYKLLQQIGEGGCGVVYMAEQSEPVRRRVALKVIKLGLDTNSVIARFEAERQALALMDHPNIARVLDAGATDAGRPYFVMELVRGIKITEYCDEAKLSTRDRLDLFIKVCQAIQHAHQKGIIHRDIKPSNILVTINDGVAVPKVIDFGIAKATEGRLTDKTLFTQFEAIIGTPAYMSPEQAVMTSLDIDTRSDIYSLGVLLYELLAGSTPFDAQELMASGIDAMRQTIREKEPVRPSTRLATLKADELTTTAKRRSADTSKLLHQLKGDLDWIVMKCLEKDRTRRYETANGLSADIMRHLTNEPVLARPPSAGYKIQKAWRRNKLAFGAGITVAGVLIGGISLTTWQAFRAERAEREKSRLLVEAEGAKEREASQRKHAVDEAQLAIAARDLARVRLVQQYLWRGQSLCEQGDLIRGLHWLVRSFREAPAHNTAFQDDARQNLASWLQHYRSPRYVLTPEGGAVTAIALLPSGEVGVTASSSGVVQLWSVKTGQPLDITVRHPGVVAIAFSPDERLMVTVGGDSVQLWETRNGVRHTAPMPHHGANGAVFNAQGGRVLTFSKSGHDAQVWNTTTGSSLGQRIQPGGRIWDAIFSPDGRRVLTANGDTNHSAQLWSSETGMPLGPPMSHGHEVVAVAFSPDGTLALTGSQDKSARLWDGETGEPVGARMFHSREVCSVAFSPDGKWVLTGSSDRTARLWDGKTGEPTKIILEHNGGVSRVGFAEGGKRLVTSSRDRKVRVWEADTGRLASDPLHHEDGVDEVFWSGHALLTRSGSRAVIWSIGLDASPPGVVLDYQTPDGDMTPEAIAFAPDGQRLLMGDYTGKTWWWSIDTREVVLAGFRHDDRIWGIDFSADGKRVLTCSGDHTARLWSLEYGERRLTNFTHTAPVFQAVFSQDGKFVATASADGTAQVWSSENGQRTAPALRHPGDVASVSFNPDGSLIATACADGAARLWSVNTGLQVGPPLRHQAGLLAVVFSPDGRFVVTGGLDKTAKIWLANTGLATGVILEHSGPVQDLVFSPDGRLLATASSDDIVRLWSPTTGALLGPQVHLAENLKDLVFSRDGRRLAAGGFNVLPTVWNIVAPLTGDSRRAELMVQLLTWQEMDGNGVLNWLDRAAWQARDAELKKLGAVTLK